MHFKYVPIVEKCTTSHDIVPVAFTLMNLHRLGELDHVKLCFLSLRMILYLCRGRVLFHGGRHVSPPCFYSSPQRTNSSREDAFFIILFVLF